MSERRSQLQSHSSKLFTFFAALERIRGDITERGRKILVWLVVVAAVVALAPAASASTLPTATALTVSSGTVTAGTVTTLTASVGIPQPGGAIDPVTRGQVVFCDANALHCDGAAVFGTAQLTASSTAVLRVILGVGTYSIVAVFQGVNNAPSSTSTAQAVTVTADSSYVSSAVIAASGAPGNYTLTGTVTTFGRATATGTVSFTDISDGNAVIGIAALNVGSLASTFIEAPQSPLSIGGGVGFVATGDFNNDGIPDLAWINSQGSSTVFVSLGVGDGSFNFPTSVSLPNLAFMLAVADLNGDGKADLIVPNSLGGTTVSVLLGNGDGTFQAPVSYFSGTQPDFVAVGDFDGDGHPDLAVVNEGLNSISILLGVGDGTFGAPVGTNTVGSGPLAVAVGDFNGDGILDLAVSNSNDSNVGILIGVGDGTFAGQTTVPLPGGAQPYWLTTGDLRKTGVLDLVVPNGSDTNAFVLLGNGDGTFATAVAYQTGDAGQGVSLGDVNGDGILDIVTANTGEDGTVSVLLGVGDGTFLTHAEYAVGNGPANVALADFNGDGMLDIADSDQGPGTVTVLLQAETQTAVATGVSAPGSGLQVTDGVYPGDAERSSSVSPSIPLTGSGTAVSTTTLTIAPNPVVVGQSTTLTATISPIPTNVPLGSVTFYEGSTVLGTATVNSSGVATLTLSSLAAGSHGLTAEYGGSAGLTGSISAPAYVHVTPAAVATVTLVLSAPSVVAGTATTLTATVLNGVAPVTSGMITFCVVSAVRCEGPTAIGTADLTSSGTAVLKHTFGVGTYNIAAVFTGDNAQQGATSATHALTVTGNASIQSGNQLTATGSAGNYTLVDQISAAGSAPLVGTISFLDTSNGNAQVATAALDPATLAYSFTPPTTPVTSDAGLGNIVTGDFNNDGILDFAMINNNNDPVVSVFIGVGDGTFHSEVNYPVASYALDLKVGDFNGDGKLDLVTVDPCDCDTSTVSVLLGNGDGTFQAHAEFNVGAAALGVAVGDFNGDGIPDLVTANVEGANISVLLGRGDGTFQPQVQYAAGGGPIYVTVGDFDGDGVLDLAVANEFDGTVSVLLGVGDGTFQSQLTYPVGNAPQYVLAADVNNDGKLDLITTNGEDNTISVLLNAGNGTFATQVAYATGFGPADVAAADLNQDGKLDLVVSNSNSGSLGVYYGLGDGTFQPPLNLSIGEVNPEGIAAGDFNGDGLTDIVESNANGGGAFVLLSFKAETATVAGLALAGVGTHNVNASYPGDASRQASLSNTVALSGPVSVVTATSVTLAPNPANIGQTVTITATISPAPTGAPLGTVAFFDNGVQIDSATVGATGIVTFSSSALPGGTDSITAVYSGNATFDTSSSAATTETVTPIATATTLVAAPVPGIVGQPVTLTATVAPAPTGGTLGTVSFYSGTTLLGVGTVNVSGVATLTSSSLPLGNNTLTAIYSGNAFSGTSTSVAVMEAVVPVGLTSTTTTLTYSPIPAVDGQSETFTVTIAPTPTGASLGTVSFYNGVTLLGMGTVNSAGIATFTTSSLPSGNLTITAVYSGNATFATSTSSVSMVTEGPGFTVVAPAGPISALQGALITIPLTVPPLGGAFNNVVTMSVTGLPPGAVAVFTPPTVTPGAAGAPTTLTIQLASAARAIPSSEHHIPAWPGAALALSVCLLCGAVVMRRGSSRKMRVALACTGLAAVALLIAGCDGSASKPPSSNYVVTITGTSGPVHSSATVTIIVK